LNIVSKSKLKKYWLKYAGSEAALVRWYFFVKKAKWQEWKDIRDDFPSADKVGDRIIFNLKGNNYRLIVIIRFFNKHIYLRWFGTYADYDKLSKEDIKNL